MRVVPKIGQCIRQSIDVLIRLCVCRVQECKKSIIFLEFCNQAFPKFSFSVVDLPSLLITPIQRIPRYQLLLKDLLKHTWPVPAHT